MNYLLQVMTNDFIVLHVETVEERPTEEYLNKLRDLVGGAFVDVCRFEGVLA